MAIEKMSFVHLSGPLDGLDDLLMRILLGGLLQPENTSKLSEYSVGDPMPAQNPYEAMLSQVKELAERLQIPLKLQNTPPPSVREREQYLAARQRELDELAEDYRGLAEEQAHTKRTAEIYANALQLLARLDEADIDFEELAKTSHLRVCFGRMPEESAHLIQSSSQLFTLHVIEREEGYVWCVYVSPAEGAEEVDRLFAQAGFQEISLPDAMKSTSSGAKAFVKNALTNAQKEAQNAAGRLAEMVERGKASLQELYSHLLVLHQAYDLRKYAVALRGHFHMVGYLLTRDEDAFKDSVGACQGLKMHVLPCNDDIPHLQTPVRLRNGRFSKPFEMFVEMYGTPTYKGIDPTPFVAWSYSLLFGIMFGDVGQGLCIVLLGWLLHRFKGMSLGPIMMRIGVMSSLFGVVYGSVFGYEHLLDGFYQNVFGLHEKPVEIFDPATTNLLLLSAVGIGIVTILVVMVLNICVGIKQRDKARIFLSSNGLPGVVFFGALIAAVLAAVSGRPIHGPAYILCLMVLPLAVMFFKEPIHHLTQFLGADSIIAHSHNLVDSIQFAKLDRSIPALFGAKYVYARFGRLPTESFDKLRIYSEDPFVLHPIKSDRDYIWCVYTTSASDRKQVDAIFHDLYFERIYIPAEMLESSEATEAFMRRCIEGEQIYRTPREGAGESSKKTILRRMFPDGIGSFVTESFFEMFEVLLSFVTNTMSFLRVGGFILSHAGMMSVVMALSEMAGAGASPVVVVIGNLFVMALEGLIVGIQVLRLEFYEIFSRFYDGGGQSFRPVQIGAIHN